MLFFLQQKTSIMLTNNSELARVSDVITVEIEHVNVDILEDLERQGHIVHPSPKTIRVIQDKYAQKQHLAAHGIALPEYMDVPSLDHAAEAGRRFGYPYVLKNKRLAYDGRGNAVVNDPSEVSAAYNKLGCKELYAEKFVPFVKELAVMVVRTEGGVVSYPVVQTIQKDNICHLVMAPAQISAEANANALSVASKAIESLPGLGIYGVELFILPDDSILLNEIAPRPHNSGHYTMEASDIDQFEMHLRAVLGLPCPVPTMRAPVALMINILGSATMTETKSLLNRAMGVSGVGIHWYGKGESRLGRKMAHLTVTASSLQELRDRVDLLDIDDTAATSLGLPPSTVERASPATSTTQAVTVARVRSPKVGIIMGSDSDLPTMKDAAEILDHFDIPYELTIVSAHRTPTRMYSYAGVSGRLMSFCLSVVLLRV